MSDRGSGEKGAGSMAGILGRAQSLPKSSGSSELGHRGEFSLSRRSIEEHPATIGADLSVENVRLVEMV